MKLSGKSLVFIMALLLSSSVSFAADAEMASEVKAQKPAGSLYDRLGGQGAIDAVVADFVSRAAADPAVNFTRKGTKREWLATPENVGKLKKHLVQFISMATGGPDKYEGKEMKEAHQGMGITESEFNALANDLRISLSRFGVSDADQEELMQIVGTTKGSIVEASSPAPVITEPVVQEEAPASFAEPVEVSKAAEVAAVTPTTTEAAPVAKEADAVQKQESSPTAETV